MCDVEYSGIVFQVVSSLEPDDLAKAKLIHQVMIEDCGVVLPDGDKTYEWSMRWLVHLALKDNPKYELVNESDLAIKNVVTGSELRCCPYQSSGSIPFETSYQNIVFNDRYYSNGAWTRSDLEEVRLILAEPMRVVLGYPFAINSFSYKYTEVEVDDAKEYHRGCSHGKPVSSSDTFLEPMKCSCYDNKEEKK